MQNWTLLLYSLTSPPFLLFLIFPCNSNPSLKYCLGNGGYTLKLRYYHTQFYYMVVVNPNLRMSLLIVFIIYIAFLSVALITLFNIFIIKPHRQRILTFFCLKSKITCVDTLLVNSQQEENTISSVLRGRYSHFANDHNNHVNLQA
jgi:hypothetical protein